MAEQELNEQAQEETVETVEQTETVDQAPVDEPVVEKPKGKGKGKKDEAVDDDAVRVKGGNASVGGVEYLADKNGIVTVTEEHAVVLVRDLGFERV